jgi:Flp pilus assembly protein CpaB
VTGRVEARTLSSPPWLRDVRRLLRRHRRAVAASLAACSVALTITALSPQPAGTVLVLAAAKDLTAGRPLTADDLRTLALPPALVPTGALRPGRDDPVGRLLAGPTRRGEPITDVRLVGPSLLQGYGDGLVAAPVRIADAASVQLLSVGDTVDVLAAETGAFGRVADASATAPLAGARAVASAARVLSMPATAPDDSSVGDPALGGGALVVLAVTDRVAAELAGAAVTARLSVTLRSPRAESDATSR